MEQGLITALKRAKTISEENIHNFDLLESMKKMEAKYEDYWEKKFIRKLEQKL